MGKNKTVTYNYNTNNKKSYNLFNFLFDCVMLVITCGFWLIWIIIREMRR